MNVPAKIKVIFLLLFPLIHFTAFGQNNYDPATDEDFNIFLMLFATVFVCGMFGAAVVGAFIAGLLAIALFGLISFGVLSTSIAVGIYKKSAAAGFKTLLFIVFGTGCGVCGVFLAAVAQYNWTIAPSLLVAAACGFFGGSLGGIILSAVSLKAVRYLIARAALKFKRP